MSFLSQHIAEQTNTVDPVTGKGSPHHGTLHHQDPDVVAAQFGQRGPLPVPEKEESK